MNRDVAIAALAALLLALGFSSVEARTVEEHPKSSFRLPSRGMLTAATGAQITVNTTEFTAQRQAVQVRGHRASANPTGHPSSPT